MEITINNQSVHFEKQPLLEELVISFTGGKTNGIAIALNGKVVAKERWATTFVNTSDNVLIITATQGG